MKPHPTIDFREVLFHYFAQDFYMRNFNISEEFGSSSLLSKT
jgi:hypothetical protein